MSTENTIDPDITIDQRETSKNEVRSVLAEGLDFTDREPALKDLETAKDAAERWLAVFLTGRIRRDYQLPLEGAPKVLEITPHLHRSESRIKDIVTTGLSLAVKFEGHDTDEPVTMVLARGQRGMDTYVVGEASGFTTVEECLKASSIS